ncbi:MAG: SemiSWEET transporter, partial [Nanoarchaeota archaeon]
VIYLGLAAATLTTFSTFPQVIKTWKRKNTDDISLLMFITIGLGVILWLIYGVVIKDVPIIYANAIAIIPITTMVCLKLKYDKKRKI